VNDLDLKAGGIIIWFLDIYLRRNPPRKYYQKFTQRMDDRIGLDGLILLIRASLTGRFDNETQREPGTLAANDIA